MSFWQVSGVAPLPTPPPSGDLVAYALEDDTGGFLQQIWTVPQAGGSPVQATSVADNDVDSDPDLSPDDSQIVYLHNPGSTSETLYVVNSDGSGNTQIDATAGCVAPNWGGGNQIVYRISNTVYTINPDGSGKTALTITGPTGSPRRPTFNRDGTLIGFQELRSGASSERLWVCAADGSGAVMVKDMINVSLNGVGFSWAHNADVIAYAMGGSSKDVRTVNADGTGDTSISDGGIAVNPGGGQVVDTVHLTRYAWSADDSEVFALQKLTGPAKWVLWSVQADGSLDVQLAAPSQTERVIGAGYPYVFGDRVYTVDDSSNLVSVALDGTDERTEDGDGGSLLFPSLQGNSTAF